MQHPSDTSDPGPGDAVTWNTRTYGSGLDHDEPNDHLALIYESQDEQFATAIPFVRVGLERGERCLYVVDDNDPGEVVEAMQAAGIDVAAARDAGLLALHTKDETYLEDGTFDAEATIAFMERTVTEAVESQGFEHVRITGEMTWMLDEASRADRETLARYESRINHYFPGEAVTGLCQYNRKRFPPEILHDVVRTHPLIVYEGRCCRNFFYVPPAQFFDEQVTEATFDRQLETLLHRTELGETASRRDDEFATLTPISQEYRSADPTTISRQALANAREVLDTEHVAICRYDEATGELASVSSGDGSECGRFEDHLWEAFVKNETRVLVGGDEQGSFDEDLVVVPLGRHGVFVAAAEPGSVADADVDFAETVGANVRAALDRADRETILQTRTTSGAAGSEHVDHLQPVTDLVRDVVTSLTEVSSRAEVYQVVCDHLVGVESWQFAWVGETTATSDQVTARASAGTPESYLDDVAVPVTDDPTTEPTGRAAATRTTQVVDDVPGAGALGDWRCDALASGFGSAVSVPLVYEDICYGVVTVYGTEPGAFGDLGRDVLDDIGRATAFACNAMERRRALVSDRATELDFRVDDDCAAFVSFVTGTGGVVSIDGIVPQESPVAEPEATAPERDDHPTENLLHVFFTVREATAEQVNAVASSGTPFESLSLVSERDDELAYEGVVPEGGFLGTLLDHAAVPKSVEAAGDDARIVVRLPYPADVSSFVGMLEERLPGAKLLACREVESEGASRCDVRSRLEADLTDRQWDALQMAYLSGYFEWPRERSGEEVGARLDVSQPTFNRHLRDSLRKLLTPIFENDPERER